MITLEQIKNIVSDIESDDSWVNDSHTGAEYRGVCNGLSMLVKHLEEIECDECKKDEVEWLNYFADYVQDNNRNCYNNACEYADKMQEDE